MTSPGHSGAGSRPAGSCPDGVRPVGYYVHHHGAGHAARFRNIARSSPRHLIPLSELDIDGGVRLCPDVPGRDSPDVILDPTAGGALHWAPISMESQAVRARTVVDWIANERPLGMVVDVSVEMALLCRLAGLATIVVRQHGDRDDDAHRLAYRSARRLIAPFPVELEHRDTPAWVVDKTVHTGFIAPPVTTPRLPTGTPTSEWSGADHAEFVEVPRADDVVVLWGSGGGGLAPDAISALADAVGTDSRVWLIGDLPDDVDRRNVNALGTVARPDRLLVNGPLVVASGGNNAVAEAARNGCALVVVPQARPFDEQHRHADSLIGAGVATTLLDELDARAWSGAMAAARAVRPALAALAAHDGAVLAAAVIEETFGTSDV